MSASVWVGEFITTGAFISCALSWAIVYEAHLRDWPSPERRTSFLRRAQPWTWVVTGCFLVTLAIQVVKWRGA